MIYRMKVDKVVTINFLALVLTVFTAGYLVGYHQTGSGFLEGVIASVVASIVFHYTLSYWESKRREKDIYKVVFPFLKGIVSTTNYSLFYASSDQSDISKLDTMISNDVQTLVDFINSDYMDEPIGNIIVGGRHGFNPQTRRELWTVQFVYGVEEALIKIKPYYYMLDSELIELLTKLENCRFVLSVTNFANEYNKITQSLFGVGEALELVQELSKRLDEKNA
ncbi:hypothetical protein [Vibrio jasicida]|uniref:hypothetical protein n=1 Tax=Vibrio jasicida TaxID=766224 RepID=UPI0011B07FB4|nr:hypothetical protein [Vibrio jasicida]